MDFENGFTAENVGAADDHAAVEAAGAEEGRIEDVRAVGGGDENHAFIRFEAVHFNQQLVECLFALIMTAA